MIPTANISVRARRALAFFCALIVIAAASVKVRANDMLTGSFIGVSVREVTQSSAVVVLSFDDTDINLNSQKQSEIKNFNIKIGATNPPNLSFSPYRWSFGTGSASFELTDLYPAITYYISVADLAGNEKNLSFTTRVQNRTRVTATIPRHNESGVSANASIRIDFNYAIDSSSLSYDRYTTKRSSVYVTTYGDENVPCYADFSSDKKTLYLEPQYALDKDATYRVYVTSALLDADRYGVEPYDFVFTTYYNDYNDSGYITNRNPSPNQTGVYRNTDISFRFTRAVTSSTVTSGNIYLRQENGGYVNCSLDYNTSSRTVTLQPYNSLSDNTYYTVYVTSGVKDSDGYSIGAASWSFRTGYDNYSGSDSSNTSLTSRYPASGATNVYVNVRVALTFNKALSESSVTSGTVYLIAGTKTTDKVVADVSYEASSRTVTLTPRSNLAYDTEYTVYIDGVRDYSGYSIPYERYSFRTQKTASGLTGQPSLYDDKTKVFMDKRMNALYHTKPKTILQTKRSADELFKYLDENQLIENNFFPESSVNTNK